MECSLCVYSDEEHAFANEIIFSELVIEEKKVIQMDLFSGERVIFICDEKQ